MLNEVTLNSKNIEIKDFLQKSNTRISQNINHKKQLFNNLANLCKNNIKLNEKEITNLLIKNEITENSGIGNGAAIPNIQDESITNIYSIFIKLLKPIKYDSIDKEPVDLIFLLLSPSNIQSHHLKRQSLLYSLHTRGIKML